jgi:uncharacterized cofD-like protein
MSFLLEMYGTALLALAEDEERMAKFLQYRFTAGEGLAGHALGNILLAGLEEALGGFDRAIEEASYFLSVRGQVLPATLDKVQLVAELADGRVIEGEAEIAADPTPIKRIWLSQRARAYERAIEAIAEADVIIIGPGSLYTSIVPNLLVEGIAEAIDRSPAEKFVIMNLMTEPGETIGYTAHDHLKVLAQYLDLRRFTGVVVNTELPPPEILEHYRREGSEPVKDDLRGAKTLGNTGDPGPTPYGGGNGGKAHGKARSSKARQALDPGEQSATPFLDALVQPLDVHHALGYPSSVLLLHFHPIIGRGLHVNPPWVLRWVEFFSEGLAFDSKSLALLFYAQ